MMDRCKDTKAAGRPRRHGAQAVSLVLGTLVLASTLAQGQTSVLSQTPLFVSQSLPPLNMLVMGRDHKLYYEAYNDASDLDGDNVIDVGYKPDKIDYYGYFNNNACYSYESGVFRIAAAAIGSKKKKCAGNTYWSGDYLNYVGTSRMDAIRRVLYGGMRVVDTPDTTVLQAAYIPRDAHSWGKAYDPARDGQNYDIADYTPLRQPQPGTRHLLAVTTLGESADIIPQLRVLNDSRFQIWDWVSQEGKAGQNNCGGSGSCTKAGSSITSYNLRVEACGSSDAALREASCKAYPNNARPPVHKPTGLLHDFGESGKMHFGLLTGSYEKNIAGGVLRRNIGDFMAELNPQTGQFKSDISGIIANIDRQRVIGYNGSTYSACGWRGARGPLDSAAVFPNPSDCAMWGNPIGEMMFETLRYFSGASGSLDTYNPGANSKDASLALSQPAWVAPYKDMASGGGGYPQCARPVMTVISDINPSYDGKLPGSRFGNIAANANALSGFNASTEVDAIGRVEGIHGKSFFIGQSTDGNADGVPTVKTIAELSWARGLSPQEPSKQGTYYAAGVARFGADNAIFGKPDTTAGNGKGSALTTYSVAIASPLPEIRFPVGKDDSGGDRFVTIVPFAKSVTGGGGSVSQPKVINTIFAPTNQIVDFYVDRIANTNVDNRDASVNGGRAYAEFRINYEDVEQGADHDMDAIARYVVTQQENGQVKIDMVSEYAAGGYGQHMGYVVSGTTRDGMYLEVRDRDTASALYAGNTPPNRDPGYCRNIATESQRTECSNLGLSASRSFTPSTEVTSTAGSFLKNPLWYAAKYGVPGRDASKIKGDPDNYFLVTNAATLKDQLTKAFNSILQTTSSVTAASVDMPTANLANGADLYRTSFEAQYWSGDVLRESLSASGKTLAWSAAQKLSVRPADDRRIYYAGRNGAAAVLRPFTFTGISRQPADAAWLAALNRSPLTGVADGLAQRRIAFLRGEADDGLRMRQLLGNQRPNVLGDIVNSSLVRVKGPLYQASAADRLEGSGSSSGNDYATFASAQAGKPEMLYIGANDGMLHAFNAATGAEVFAFIPSGVKDALGLLTTPNYGGKGGLSHRYYVDGNQFVADVHFADAWHRVLIGGLGAGGRQIFALDITDPEAPSLLWEFGSEQHGNMGHSVPKPSIARLNDTATGKGKWVVLLPNGYEGDNSKAGNASLFVLDVSNGSILKRFDLEGGMNAQELAAALPLGNGLSRLSAIDNNTDGKVDMAYAGDLAGNVWRLDLSSGSSADWTARRFFTARDAAGQRQSITAAPLVVRHPTGAGDLVIVGTGRFMADADKLSTGTQTVYGIWDRYSSPGSATPGTLPSASKNRSHLQAQTLTELEDYPGKFWLSAHPVPWYTGSRGTRDTDVSRWGWYLDLPRRGERLVYDMSLYGRGLVFTSIRTSRDPCDGGMNSTLYDIDPNTGGQTQFVPFDVRKDGLFNAGDSLGGRQISGYEVGAGKQSISGGILFNPDGEKAVAQQDSGAGINHGVDVGRQSWRRQPAN